MSNNYTHIINLAKEAEPPAGELTDGLFRFPSPPSS